MYTYLDDLDDLHSSFSVARVSQLSSYVTAFYSHLVTPQFRRLLSLARGDDMLYLYLILNGVYCRSLHSTVMERCYTHNITQPGIHFMLQL